MLTLAAQTMTLMTLLTVALTTALLFTPATARAQAEEVVYYHTDAIGSVRAITDATGAVIERYDFLAFGEALPSTVPEARQFVGKERDAETGLDYFGARHHMSATGRFTTVDPVMNVEAAMTDPQRWNRYAYALNKPFKFTDPDGRAGLFSSGGVRHPQGDRRGHRQADAHHITTGTVTPYWARGRATCYGDRLQLLRRALPHECGGTVHTG